MISAAKLAANRANARASTGPRSAEGKKRSARNALRHGLTLPALPDPTRANEVEALSRAIAGADALPQHQEAAFRVAAAQIDLVGIQRARCVMLSDMPLSDMPRDPRLPARLAALDRYERRVRWRRRFAIRDLDAARSFAEPKGANWQNEPNGGIGKTNPTGELPKRTHPAK